MTIKTPRMTPTRIARQLRRFAACEDGTLTLEFLIFSPLMVWTFCATLAYFDVYRTEAVAQKAAMTVADMITREQEAPVDNRFVDGAYDLLKFLTRHDATPEMRVSVLRYHLKDNPGDGDDSVDHYHVVWSQTRGVVGKAYRAPLTGKVKGAAMNRLPRMGNGDRLVLVETWTDYNSPYNVGLKSLLIGGVTDDGDTPEMRDIELASHIFAAPRGIKVCYQGPARNGTTPAPDC